MGGGGGGGWVWKTSDVIDYENAGYCVKTCFEEPTMQVELSIKPTITNKNPIFFSGLPQSWHHCLGKRWPGKGMSTGQFTCSVESVVWEVTDREIWRLIQILVCPLPGAPRNQGQRWWHRRVWRLFALFAVFAHLPFWDFAVVLSVLRGISMD